MEQGAKMKSAESFPWKGTCIHSTKFYMLFVQQFLCQNYLEMTEYNVKDS